MKKFILGIISLISLSVTAQQPVIQTVWEENPQFASILPENSEENIVGIFFREKYEYYYNANGDLEIIHTQHKKLRLKTDDAIDQYNKISISISDVLEVIEIKARAVKPSGKVVVFDSNSIKEVKDEDNENSYKIFAIDGIEKGDEIEYYVITKTSADSFGRTYFQYSYPLQEGSFEIVSPTNLLYDIKGYNGFPSGIHEKLSDGRNRFYCTMTNIPLIKEEKFSNLSPRKARIEYRLDYNLERSKSQRYTWDDAAQRIYEMMYMGNDEKVMTKWIKSIPIKSTDQVGKAAEIESYLKTNIYIQDFYNPDFDNLEFILKNKVTSAKGMAKLMVNLFKAVGIDHQVVLTVQRDRVKFDGGFQSWNYLDDYLIYLPEGKTYIDPANNAYRMGCVNGNLTGIDGLFVKLVKIGAFESAIAEIKYIEPTPYTSNYSNMIIDASIDVDKNELHVNSFIGFKGLSGGYFANYYKMMDEKQKTNLLEQLSHVNSSETNFIKLQSTDPYQNPSMADAEFTINAEYTTPSFIEVAGNKILVNIGSVIGEQVEMYFEKDRKATVENEFNRMYYREITVKVPKGYKIVNPEATIMNFVQQRNNTDIYGFISNYSYQDDEYKIIINEYYKEIYAGFDELEGFKQVVNAAADFNKIVLVLEKK